MTKTDLQVHATGDIDSVGGCADRRTDGGAVPSGKTRKSIRRYMQERLERDAYVEFLDDAVHEFSLTTLRQAWDVGDDEDTPPNSPILTEKSPISAENCRLSLKGGCPNSTPHENMPKCVPAKTHNFGGYDGGFAVGVSGVYPDEMKRTRWFQFLEEGKKRAGENPNGEFVTCWGEHPTIVFAGSAKEGLLYKYRIEVGGVVMLFHDSHNVEQKIRVRVGAELFLEFSPPVIWGRVRAFFDAIGFVFDDELPSRVDVHVTTDCVSMADLAHLGENDYVVTKMRDVQWNDKGLGKKAKSKGITLGTRKSPVRFSAYDKRDEGFGRGSKFGSPKQVLLMEKVSPEWVQDISRPMTRIEWSLKREALRAMGYNRIEDLFGNEWAFINLLTLDWVRILKEPKKDGHEWKQELHPVWVEIRRLFRLHFPGGSDDAIAEWKTPDRISCDPVALERQALGCIAKAQALRHGSQENSQSSVKNITDWVEKNQDELHGKINGIALTTEIKTGFPLGHDVDRECADVQSDMVEQGNRSIEKFRQSFPPPVQQFYEPPGDSAGERFQHFIENTEKIHWRRKE
jgi:hypothetical protein